MPRRCPLYIFDLDGTLCNTDHRDYLLARTDARKWDDYFKACENDTPISALVQIFVALRKNASDILIFTGRGEQSRKQTIGWLAKYIPSETAETFEGMLTMRPINEHTPDTELKKRWFGALSDLDKSRLVAVFEDRDSVVKMWRDLDIVCLQVAPGKF